VQLNLKSALDYESYNLQRPLFIVTADDGACTSRTYTYTLSVTDVNEPPVIKPKNQILSVYEGN
ncbi:cadherin egf lag seven-pass g-type receptor 2, partial [Biomphalaria glabrata]